MASGASDRAATPSDAGAFGGPSPSAAGGSSGTAGAGGAPAPPLREIETRLDIDTPRAGARYVYVANSRRNIVSVIDSTTLVIRPVEVGDNPSVLRTLPGKDAAIVINGGSSDATILRTATGGVTRTSTVRIVAGANALSVAPDGRHAVVWYNGAAPGASARPGGGSFQDVSLITLADDGDRAAALTVGFRPTDVVFSQDNAAAFVVTDDGISLLRFADIKGPARVPLVRLVDGFGSAARDVSVTPDGRYAIARKELGTTVGTVVTLVDLVVGSAVTVDLKGFVTDLDLTPSGSFALAVLRRESAVVRIPVPAGFSDPTLMQTRKLDDQMGSATLSSDGKRAVLYVTAEPIKKLAILDIEGTAPATAVRLRKAVAAVVLSSDNRTAIVLHTKLPGDPGAPGLDFDAQLDRMNGYSVVDIATGFAKLQTTDAKVDSIAITADATRAFLTIRDKLASPPVRMVHGIRLDSLFTVAFPMGSAPISVAALADTKRIFVSQEHPEGRISFIHWETDAVTSVTGFELNGRIVQ